MSRSTPWSTSVCSSDGRAGRRRAAAALAALALCAALPATAAARSHKPGILLTLAGPAGERDVETDRVEFVYFTRRFKRTRAPVEESATRQRTQVIDTRKACRCVRFADWSKVRMSRIREIALSYPPGARVAEVRITRRDGKVRTYAGDTLWGGDGQFPPRFATTVDGIPREFPLVLDGRSGSAWPEERLIRILLVRSPPPRPPRGRRH